MWVIKYNILILVGNEKGGCEKVIKTGGLIFISNKEKILMCTDMGEPGINSTVQ